MENINILWHINNANAFMALNGIVWLEIGIAPYHNIIYSMLCHNKILLIF